MLETLTEAFVPAKLRFRFGEKLAILVKRDGNVFVCHQELEEDLECSEIEVKTEDMEIAGAESWRPGYRIDTIPREIKLRKGDILHFEYSIDVKFG